MIPPSGFWTHLRCFPLKSAVYVKSAITVFHFTQGALKRRVLVVKDSRLLIPAPQNSFMGK